ncbi:hypothetical protein QKU48_gp0710 [Fadolivirus algeromassiliense]|jgi:hypothetical protein|uniref:Uncharacterized protein n=1 Tax=Fadolivirus FV1/VV64 TaxID=3070911 RepID=A0A7D3UPS6_9VIRU|nr:hypothetical protein QKU48_gp0710 [Fadolivirus algeromassiliense]QKF94168.1 hypothetical protein Fadolivirus_1_710 [Fadolivirus FV1/VV64]
MNKQESVEERKTLFGYEFSFSKLLKIAIFIVIVALLYMLVKNYLPQIGGYDELPLIGISSPSTLEISQMTAERLN